MPVASTLLFADLRDLLLFAERRCNLVLATTMVGAGKQLAPTHSSRNVTVQPTAGDRRQIGIRIGDHHVGSQRARAGLAFVV